MLTTSQGRFHKIILVACRNISKGEELFFDYGYSEEKKHQIDWMKYFVKKFMFNKQLNLKRENIEDFPLKHEKVEVKTLNFQTHALNSNLLDKIKLTPGRNLKKTKSVQKHDMKQCSILK